MRVEKFNENHDEHGRFDTGSGGTRPDPMPPADPFHGDLRATSLGKPSGEAGKSSFKVGKTNVTFDGSKVSVEKAADLRTKAEVGLNAIDKAQGGLGVDDLHVNVATEMSDQGNAQGTATAWYTPTEQGTLNLNGTLNDAGNATASLDLVHEYGHMLDYERTSGRAATLDETGGIKGMHFPGTSSNEDGSGAAGNDNQTGILNAIARSDGFNGIGYQISDPPTLSYFRSPQEAFARGYSQWVSEKSANPTMLKQLGIQRDNYVGMWETGDFMPIYSEYDKWAASAKFSSVKKAIQPFYMVGFLKYNENHDEKGMFASGPAAPASLAGTNAADLHSIIGGSHSPNSPALDRARTRLARQSNDGKVGSTNLSSAAEAIKSPDGGFTFNPGTGETATHGFAVGIHPELSQQFDVAQMSTPEVKSTIANYAAKNSAVLAQPGNFMGGWHDPETGKGWLDVSKVVPTARMARNLSTTHDQISFYDMQRGESVTVNAKAKSGQ